MAYIPAAYDINSQRLILSDMGRLFRQAFITGAIVEAVPAITPIEKCITECAIIPAPLI